MYEDTRVTQFPLVPLYELASRITDGSHFSPTPQEHGYIIANVKDMKSGEIDINSCTRISAASYSELKASNCIIRKGNVLLSKDGTVGRVVVYQQEEEIGALSSICIIEPSDKLVPAYLGHALRSNICIRQFENFMSGSALRRLVLRDIRSIEIPLPSIEQQVVIAKILDTVDTVIRDTENIIDKLNAVKKGLLYDLLTRGIDDNGELRPPQCLAPQRYKNSPIGWIPKEWECRELSELADYVNGNTFDASLWAESGLPIIRIQNLNGSSDFNFYTGTVQERWHVHPGDLLFAWSGQRGVSFGARIWSGPEGVLNQHIFKVLPKEKIISKAFLFRLLRFRQSNIEDSAHGFKDSFLHVTRGELGAVKAGVPSAFEQQHIEQCISAHEQKLLTEEATLRKLKTLKSGLMNDLLSGHVRATPLLEVSASCSPKPISLIESA